MLHAINSIIVLLIIADEPCENGGSCSHICAVVEGQAQCFCPIGFELEEPLNMQCVGKEI